MSSTVNQRTLLTVVAHPDDESFGLGGTLARYVQEGWEVHVVVATDGVAGSVAEGHEASLADLVAVRQQELETAVAILGVTLHQLGYRDSGYTNDPANEHPDAFIRADQDEVVSRLVALIRQIRPQVVITHDETGTYFHPDHIFCCTTTTLAFHAAGDPDQYPQAGSPYQPDRLYYGAISDRWIKIYILLLRLRRQDPTRMGRNNDIDMTQLGIPPHRLHAVIDYSPYWDIKKEASAAHSSQGGGTPQSRFLPEWFLRRFMAKENFIRAHPPAPDGYRVNSLLD
jgi:LmbE family N-acetylglucosaminyl deacetylase